MGYFFTARFSYACTISSKFGKSCYFLVRCILMLAVAATYKKVWMHFTFILKVQHIEKIFYFWIYSNKQNLFSLMITQRILIIIYIICSQCSKASYNFSDCNLWNLDISFFIFFEIQNLFVMKNYLQIQCIDILTSQSLAEILFQH